MRLSQLQKKFLRPRLIGWLGFVCLLNSVHAQQTEPTPRQKEDVVRVFTELVQTDVMVFDKQGRFVKDLKREDFELRIDGHVRPIQSFDQITAGTSEETQLAAARSETIGSQRPVPLDRGRIVFFYVDDFHLDLSGLTTARKVITTFIDKEMGQNDQAAISSATGQIGFLQQLTDDRSVLHAALAKLNYRNYSVRDSDRPSMSEYQAVLIDREDIFVMDYFINETMRLNPGLTRDMAASIVRGRAHQMLDQAGAFNNNMLLGLERLVRQAKDLPGRKVVFLLSNGFLIENNRSDSRTKVRDVIGAAARSGVVIYSLDTRGLVASLEDISAEPNFDPSGQLQNATHGELIATQDGMHSLAVDTGGRAIFNTNDLSKGLAPAMKETSTYYLLAWKPESDVDKSGRFRKIEVGVVGRPDLTVRVRRGFFDVDPTAKPTPDNTAEANKPVSKKLSESILAAYPKTELPLTLGLNFYDLPEKGPTVSASVEVPGEFIIFGPQSDGKIQAVLDVAGVFFNDRGENALTFGERIVTTAPSMDASKDFHRDITYTYPGKLGPGLYQVRVAVRDNTSGRVGSAQGWINVPNLTDKKLALSSLILGQYTPSQLADASTPAAERQTYLSASHRFRRESNLRLLLFTYNGTLAPTDQKPDLAVQVQVIRDDQPVLTTSLRKVSVDGVPDLSRVPYAADISLKDMQPGRYVLQVSVIDRLAKQSATQQTHFDIY
ncbi:MAG: hypothetical protein C5B55_13845 [Blastocatellia bacterium]|nr:MAG: hypothetical protein C5B55_13845 [Blastocatellia bacterium]